MAVREENTPASDLAEAGVFEDIPLTYLGLLFRGLHFRRLRGAGRRVCVGR